jgi:glutaredoxin
MPTLERDTDGKILHSHLTSKEAASMGQKRWSKAYDDKINSLLTSRGLDPTDCDEGIKALAKIAVTGRSGAVSALRYLDTLTNFYNPNQGDIIKVGPSEQCPYCKRYPNPLNKLGFEVVAQLVEYARKRAEVVEGELVAAEAEDIPNPSAEATSEG